MSGALAWQVPIFNKKWIFRGFERGDSTGFFFWPGISPLLMCVCFMPFLILVCMLCSASLDQQPLNELSLIGRPPPTSVCAVNAVEDDECDLSSFERGNNSKSNKPSSICFCKMCVDKNP